MPESPHSVATLKELMDERDRRYTDNRKCDQDAVQLAKEIADKAQGKVSIVAAVSVVSGVLSAVALIHSLLQAAPK